jgi:hypothetical protein
MMAERRDGNLEAALEVFEVFASGSLTDEVYIRRTSAASALRHRPDRLQGALSQEVSSWRS